jgi:uncharacterized protein with von Willebrand factor type A (vWA) domain
VIEAENSTHHLDKLPLEPATREEVCVKVSVRVSGRNKMTMRVEGRKQRNVVQQVDVGTREIMSSLRTRY